MRRTPVVVGVVAAGAGATAAVVGRRRVRRVVSSWATNPDACDGDPETMPPGREVEVTTADGAVLRGVDCGQGPTVVLAHCWTGTRGNWAPVARRLVDAGHRVVAFDQRGHGRSDRGTEGYRPETLAADLAAVLTDLDLRPAVLAGHSMGGLSAMALAAYHRDLVADRVGAMVLVATLAAPPMPPRVPDLGVDLAPVLPLLERRMRHPDYGLLGMLGVFGTSPARCQLDAARRGFLDTDPTTRAEAMSMMLRFDLRPVLCDIDVPTRIVAGARDQLTWPHTNQAIADLIPGASIEFLPGRGHMLPWEDPDTVTRAILDMAATGGE